MRLDLGDERASSSSLSVSQVNKSKRKQPGQCLADARDGLSLALSISKSQATVARVKRCAHLVPDCPVSAFVDWYGLEQMGTGEMILSVETCAREAL